MSNNEVPPLSLSHKTTGSSGQDLPQKLFAQYPWSNQTDHVTRFTQVPTHIWPGHQAHQVIGGSSTSPTSSSPSSPSSSSATASSSSSSSTRSLMSVPSLVSFKTGWLWILQVARTLRNLDCGWERSSRINKKVTKVTKTWQLPNVDVHPQARLSPPPRPQQQSQLPHLLLCRSQVLHQPLISHQYSFIYSKVAGSPVRKYHFN